MPDRRRNLFPLASPIPRSYNTFWITGEARRRGMPVGENLRAIRERRGLSQAELWRRSGVAQPSISEIETGHRGAQIRTLTKLADALGVPVAELFREETPPKVPPPPKTPLTDEPESEFDARFGATDLESAEALREKVGAEFDAINGYIKQLKAAGVEEEAFPLRLALARQEKAAHRLYAIQSRELDLARVAEFGEARQVHDRVAGYAPRIAEAEAFWTSVIEAEEGWSEVKDAAG